MIGTMLPGSAGDASNYLPVYGDSVWPGAPPDIEAYINERLASPAQRMVATPTHERPWHTCNHCGEWMKSQAAMDDHRLTVHGVTIGLLGQFRHSTMESGQRRQVEVKVRNALSHSKVFSDRFF